MKAIKKSTLLEIARLNRKCTRTNGENAVVLPAKTKAAKELATQAYGDDDVWIAFAEFVSAVVGAYALYPECTDEEICDLFRALKFEVLDE